MNANVTLIKVGLEHRRQDEFYKEPGQWLSPKKDWPESLVFALKKNYFYSCVTSRRELESPDKDLQWPVQYPYRSWGLPEAASLSCQMQTGQEPREPSGLREKEREDGKEQEGGGKREGRKKGSRKTGWRKDKRKENSKVEERNLLLFHKLDHCCQMTVDTVKHTNNLSC